MSGDVGAPAQLGSVQKVWEPMKRRRHRQDGVLVHGTERISRTGRTRKTNGMLCHLSNEAASTDAAGFWRAWRGSVQGARSSGSGVTGLMACIIGYSPHSKTKGDAHGYVAVNFGLDDGGAVMDFSTIATCQGGTLPNGELPDLPRSGVHIARRSENRRQGARVAKLVTRRLGTRFGAIDPAASQQSSIDYLGDARQTYFVLACVYQGTLTESFPMYKSLILVSTFTIVLCVA